MPRFKVRVISREDDPFKTRAALDASGIPSIGPASAGFTDSPDSWTTAPSITAVLDADSPEVAESRVREAVGDRADVESAEPL